MKLIFLIGKKRSGKDTTADYIRNNHITAKYQLAGPIKDALAHAFKYVPTNAGKITRSQLEGVNYDREENLYLTKEEVVRLMKRALFYLDVILPLRNVFFENERMLSFTSDEITRVINSIEDEWSVRRLMQALGTDLVVNVFDRMYWVKLFSLTYLNSYGTQLDYFIVPDTRQDHELDAARSMGATVIHVVRPENENSKKDTHITERGLPILDGDIVINNNGSLEELFEKIEKAIK